MGTVKSAAGINGLNANYGTGRTQASQDSRGPRSQRGPRRCPHRFAEGHLRTSRPGVLLIRTELQGLSKKYGKSQIAAGIALTLLYADGEPAAEIHGPPTVIRPRSSLR